MAPSSVNVAALHLLKNLDAKSTALVLIDCTRRRGDGEEVDEVLGWSAESAEEFLLRVLGVSDLDGGFDMLTESLISIFIFYQP